MRKKAIKMTSILASAVLIGFAIYSDELKNLPFILRGPIILTLSILSLFLNDVGGYIDTALLNREISQKNKAIQRDLSQRQTELAELRDLIANFLEHSEIYREKVINKLKLNEDYLCIVKSSEGLGRVYEAMGTKRQFPFTKVLSDIPGSIRPFERMGMFLIPVRSIPKVRKTTPRDYIDTEILPAVERERVRFLSDLPARIARTAEPLSFKYIAFYIRKEVITHGVRNRKFNHSFNSFIVNEQIGKNFKDLKSELVKVIKVKEIFQLVDWAAFAQLNSEQQSLVDYYRDRINEVLERNGIDVLSDLTKTEPSDFANLLWPVVYRKTTKKKLRNIAQKVINGAVNTIRILEDAGVAM